MNVPDKFNTQVDIKLREWADTALPSASVRAGGEALAAEFASLLQASGAPPTDALYEPVKQQAVEEALGRHQWEERAQDVNTYILLFQEYSLAPNLESKV